MTPVQALLEQLRERDIVLRVEDGALRFRAPKGALTPALRAQLQANSAALIAHLQPAPAQGAPRMSLAQERIWFLYRFEGPSSTYSITPVFRLRGPLSRPAMATALQALVARHETLRTRFAEVGGVGVQLIDPTGPVPLRTVTVAGRDAAERMAAAERIILEETARPFDLEHEHALRVTLLELGESDAIFLPFMHHIVADGWSLGVFQHELTQLYESALRNQAAPLAPLACQYREFAAEQRQALEGARGREGVAWWVSRLEGAPQLLALPLDFERPAEMTFNGRVLHRQLPADATAALAACARAHGCSLFMALLAAYAVLLHRHSGQTDLLIGSPVAGRTTRNLEALVGCFVNTLVLRVRLTPGTTFADLLWQVRQEALDAYAWQDIPIEAVIDGMEVERDPSRMPLFQTQLSLQNVPQRTAEVSGLRVEPMRMDRVAAKNDLSFILEQDAGGIHAEIEYNTSLFLESTVEALWEDFARLTTVLVQAPETTVASISAWDSEAPQAALPNDGPADLVSWFNAVAATHADLPAVRDEHATLTYLDLAWGANAVAARLGAHRREPVCILTGRSVDLVIAIVGALMAGAAYVPMSPDHPPERLRAILADSGARALVCDAANEPLARRLAAGSAVEVVPLREAHDDQRAAARMRPAIAPDDLAYIIFTSGSTGRPKGVMIEHRSCVNLVHALRDLVYAELGPRLNVALVASTVFDASVQQIFAALLQGHTLCIVPDELRRDGEGLCRWMREHRIDVSDGTPALLDLMLHGGLADHEASLRHLLIGGEPLPADLLRRLFAGTQGRRIAVTNVYGPTECCVDVVAHRVDATTPLPSGAVIPIGRAMRNCHAAIVDEDGLPVGPGMPGELLIGGACVGRGYVNNAAQTAERFGEFPAAGLGRAYRTGDLCRRRRDGLIEFLGRNDDQVKILGHRIELGEVEHHLRAHPAIDQVTVQARQTSRGYRELVAYVVPRAAHDLAALNLAELRRFAAARMPAYMVPAYFVTLEALALNESGKIARNALPDPEEAAPLDSGTEFRAASSDAEQALAAAWMSTLKVARVGIRDNYFASGGDSIKALQLASRLRDAGWAVAIRDILRHPTIEELARHLARVDRTTAAPAPKAFESGRVPLSAVQQYFFATYGATPAFNQAILLQPLQPISPVRLRSACAALARRHEMLRCRFVREGDGWMQEVLPASEVTPRVEHLDLGRSTRAVEDLQSHAARMQAGFVLDRAPLWSAALYDMPQDSQPNGRCAQRLLFTAHHLIVDGVSWRILLEDLQRALEDSAALDALPPATPYAAYVEDQARAAASTLEAEQSYWRTLPVAATPAEHDRHADRREMRCLLSTADTADLLTHAHHAYATQMNDLLLAAVSRAWCAWSGERRCALTIEGHGREPFADALDLGRTVGWFTSLYPLTIEHAPGGDIGTAITTVQKALRAVPGRGAGYAPLRYLRADGAQLPPLGGLAFNYLGRFDEGSDAIFAAAPEALPPTAAPEVPLPWPVEVTASVVAGRMQLFLAFSARRVQEPDAARLLRGIEAELAAIVRHTIPAPATLARAQIERVLPLTPLQEGLYFHALESPESEAYLEQWSLRVAGTLEPALVREAWDALFARHEIFRALFVSGDGTRPMQVVLRERHCEVTSVDLSAQDRGQQEARLAELRAADRRRGFRIDAEPLVRVQLVKLDQASWEILWTHHHLVLDGWSAGIVQAEFVALYAARRSRTPHTLAPAPAFSQFVRAVAPADTAFWSEYLAGYDSNAELPAAENTQPSELARTLLTLPGATVARIEALCRTEGVTLSAFVQAVWGTVLARYAYSDDVVFGQVMSGRDSQVAGVERMVGMLINTVPLRVRLDAAETFRALLQRLQRANADLAAHQGDSLTAIQRALGRSTPLFSHVVALQNLPLDEALRDSGAAGFQVTAATSYDRTHYGFDLVVIPGRETLSLRFSWDRARHDDGAMQRLAAQLGHVIDTVLGNPDIIPCRVNILPPAQWNAVVEAPNRTAAGYPTHASILDLFARHVQANPEAPAVMAPHRSRTWTTYAGLDARAHAVAAHLVHDLGIAAGSRIAIHLPPSVESVVAVLGVLKAGCTYVPIDTAYPEERVAFLLRDSGAVAVLSAAQMDAMPRSDARAVARTPAPGDVAYIIYTSGSTGLPKGCQVTHRNVVRLLSNERFDFDFGAADVWIMSHALSFDFSVWEIYGALLHGGRLVIPSREVVQDVPAFRELLSHERVTVLNQTPQAFYNLVALEASAPRHDLAGHLRYVIFGGDKLEVESLRPWTAHYPADQVALVNMYGITETTVHVTYCRLDAAMIAQGGRSPIGRPLPETRVYVCDQHLNPQPLGARGEMLVGGSGVCAGYLDRPELTAQRFVPDTFNGSGTLYRSGDLAWRDAHGALQFVGRNDHQVKIRGHRIETGEVRHALLAVAGVEQAAVLVERGAAGAELLACVAGRTTAAAVRSALAGSLPTYAIPTAIVVCTALPLTAHGKVDAAAIRALRDGERASGSQFAAPEGKGEALLAAIWSAVLGIERVGRHDRFIELGGDSIKSIQVLARLRAQGHTLDLRDFFAHPSIAELAPRMRQHAAASTAADDGTPFALTPIQARFFAVHPVDAAHYNQALLLRCAERLDETRLRAALQALLDAHAALRLRFDRDANGHWQQRVTPRVEPCFSVTDLRHERDAHAALRAASAREQEGMDFVAGPTFRAALYQLPDGDRLLLAAHHLAVDGVTWRIVLEDLEALLRGTSLPAPSASWRDCVQALATDAAMRNRALVELPYWQTMDPAPPRAADPRLADPGRYADAVEELIACDVARSEALRRACNAYSTNVGELLLAALARALGRWTGAERMQVALEGHGRDLGALDTSRTAGWFTTLYPHILDLREAAPGVRIRAVKESLRRVPQAGAGYGVLRHVIRDTPGAPLAAAPPVAFNYLGELSLDRSRLLCACDDPIAPAASPRGPRPFALEVAAISVDGQLRISLAFAGRHVAPAERLRLRAALGEELDCIITHCLGRGATELTPADLSHTSLSLVDLDALFDED